MEAVINNGGVLIEVDKRANLLCLKWESYAAQDKVKGLLLTFIHLTRLYKIENWILNAENSELVVDREFLPKIIEALHGHELKKLARVVSKNLMSESVLLSYMKDQETIKAYRIFHSYNEALNWVEDNS